MLRTTLLIGVLLFLAGCGAEGEQSQLQNKRFETGNLPGPSGDPNPNETGTLPTPTTTPNPSDSGTVPTPTPAPSGNPSPSPTPVPSPTGTPIPSPTGTPEPTPTATPIPSPTGTPEPTPTATPIPTPTATPIPTPTATPIPSPTGTPEPTPTATPIPTPTATPIPTPTATPIPSPTGTPEPTPTATPIPTPTATPIPTPTATPIPSPTGTPEPTPTATPIPTPTATPVPSPTPGECDVSTGLLVVGTCATTVDLSGNAAIVVEHGSIDVNSKSVASMTLSGNAGASAPEINLAGSYVIRSNNAYVHGTVHKNVRPMSDPLASLPVPNSSSMPRRSNSSLSYSKGSITLDPGAYMGSIDLSGKASVQLRPGIYYIKGGLKLSGQASLVGRGVTLYFDLKSSGGCGGGGSASVQLTGQGELDLEPPTSGTYSGVTLFLNRSVRSQLKIVGQGRFDLKGTVYAKAAALDLSGNGSQIGNLVIVDTVKARGNGNFVIQANDRCPR